MTPTNFLPYTTLAKVQAETKNDDNKNRNWFAECIMDASRVIDEYTCRDFHPYTGTEAEPLLVQSTWISRNRIFLPFPIVNLAVVKFENEVIASEEWVWENAGQLDKGGSSIYRKGGIFWSGNTEFPCFGPDFGVISLQGEFGYGEPEGGIPAANEDLYLTLPQPPAKIPARITRAATLIAASFSGLNRKEVIDFEGNKEGFNEYRIPKEAEKLLKPYKLRPR